MIRYLLALLIVTCSFQGHTQADKKLKKAIAMYQEDPVKGIMQLRKYIDKEDVARPEAWDLYVEMFETLYNQQVQYNSMVNPELLSAFEIAMLEQDYQLALSNLVDACREATLRGRSVRGDANIRNLFLNWDPDTTYLDSAAYLSTNMAYAYINASMADSARPLLDSIIPKYPESFNINMCYYLYHISKEQSDSAIIYLKKTIELFPDHTIPRENLAQIYYSTGNVYRAKEQVEELLTLYPGEDIKNYYREILFIENKELDDHRLTRKVFPNQVGYGTSERPNKIWAPYQDALLKVQGFSSSDGVIKDNDITNERYLEIYSWQQMLNYHRGKKPDELAFAYEMEDAGYLDCYVFFSNFHVDFAGQVLEFSKEEENRERMKSYIKKYCVQKLEQ